MTPDLFAPVPWNDYNIIQYDSITCYNDMDASIVVQGTTTGVTFTWSDGGSGLTRTGLDAGTYELWLTTTEGCQDTLSATYTQPNEIIPTWSSTTTSCPEVDDGTITFTATGGNGTLNFQIDGNPITPGIQTGIGDGTYTLGVGDSRGCWETTSLVVPANTSWHDYSVTASSNPTCSNNSDGTLTVAGTTAGISVAWSDAGSGLSRTGLAPGTYDTYITNAAGCDDTLSTTLVAPTAIDISYTQNNASCFGDSDGSIDMTVSGGTAPYSFSWNDPSNSTSEDINGLPAGSYTITVTDDNSCIETETITITEPTALSLATTPTNVSCNGGSDGEIDLTPSGGTAPYSYSWDDAGSSTTQDINSSPLERIMLR